MNKGNFKKGQIPWNKGVKGIHLSPDSEFKKGQFVGQDHPSWQGGIQQMTNDCTYINSGNGKRIRAPKFIYEQNFGKVPEGFIIFHKDGIKHNDEPSNLEAISRGELIKRNKAKNK